MLKFSDDVLRLGRGRHYIVHVETGYQLGAAISNWRLALKLARRIAEPSNAEYFYGLEANKLTNRHKSASKVFSRLVDEIFGK